MPSTARPTSSSAEAGPSASRYGWVVVVLASLIMVATLPGRTHGLGLITEPLVKDLGTSRLVFADINLWATLIGAVFSLPVGWLIDRVGLRVMSTAMLLATGASAWALCHQNGAFWPLLIAVILTRGFGQVGLSLASITSVGKWFPRRPGPAMGVYAFLIGLFFVAAFQIVGWDVQNRGWRPAWSTLSASLVFVLAPLALLVMREAPREPAPSSGSEAGPGLSLAEALRTPAFWIFSIAVALYGLVSSGLGLFQQAVLEEHGFTQPDYIRLMGVTTGLALVSQLVSGWLSLRCSMSALTGLSLFVYGAALLILPWMKTPLQLWTFAALMGLAGGIIMVAFFAIWGIAFGRAQLGRIQAAAQAIIVLASAVGPKVFEECHVRTGSYSPILIGLAPVVFLSGIAAWRVRLPMASRKGVVSP